MSLKKGPFVSQDKLPKRDVVLSLAFPNINDSGNLLASGRDKAMVNTNTDVNNVKAVDPNVLEFWLNNTLAEAAKDMEVPSTIKKSNEG